jgi:hypothetical protein
MVMIECAGRKLVGTVMMASGNGKSLALAFDAILDGHVAGMPVLLGDDGRYRSVMNGVEVQLTALGNKL